VATVPPPPGAATTFGQTEWSPGEAVKFFRALAVGCLLSSSQTGYVLGLMQNIEPSESWGLGSAGFSSVAFKGGWGPESGGYLVRQSGTSIPAHLVEPPLRSSATRRPSPQARKCLRALPPGLPTTSYLCLARARAVGANRPANATPRSARRSMPHDAGRSCRQPHGL
jgi:hypothetical protein